MALSRRTGARFQASIWPGFVDAMTGLLLVLMFVLTIFMVVQFVLRETITGQETQLDSLSHEVEALAQALGLEQERSRDLDAQVGSLSASLRQAQNTALQQATLIETLIAQRDEGAAQLEQARNQITGFEARIAGLLAERAQTVEKIARLEGEQSRLLSEQEALNAALAQSRTEIDAQAEAARLAASKREALEALIADLTAQNNEAQDRMALLEGQLTKTQEALSQEEADRLAEAAALENLRARLKDADAELTAMTLQLEQKRQEAEDTLTLLAAARAAEGDLNAQLVALLAQMEAGNAQTEQLRADLQALQAEKEQAESALNASGEDLSRLQNALESARQDAESYRALLNETDSQSATLQTRLNAANQQISTLQNQIAEMSQDSAQMQEQLTAALAEKLTARQSLESAEQTEQEIRKQLIEALAARLQAENAARDASSTADQKEILLATAREALDAERAANLEAQRQTELLNQQVAALRLQIEELGGLLEAAESRDEAAQIQLQSLGSELNTALARAVAEERRRRMLEEAERARIEEERKRLQAQTQDLEQYRSEFFGRLRKLLSAQEGVRIEGDRFVFSSEVLFPPGDAQLSEEGRQEIAKVANILQSVAKDIPSELNWILRVDGHTDTVPISGQGDYADNWELSQARALSVVKYMINTLGLPPNRLAANGFGQYQPINPQDTPQARAQNRRIEIKLTEK